MFKEEETQYCPMCEEWAKKYEALEKQVQSLKIIKKSDWQGHSMCLYAELNKYRNENNKLKTTLQEIKQLTTEAKTKQFVDMEDFWEQILQKCEVIDCLTTK